MTASAVLTAGGTAAAVPAVAEPGDDIPRTQSADLRWAALEAYQTVAECQAAGVAGQQSGRFLSWRCSGTQLEQQEIFITLSATGAIRHADGRCLDIPGGDDDNGTSVRLYPCNGTKAQRWTFDATGQDSIRAFTTKCLDVQGGATHNGARVQIYTCNRTGAQLWALPSDGTRFWIRNGQAGRCVASNGDGSVITDCATGGALWSIIPG